ncbi:hypothetical protein TrVE_jg10079 [Triparma verrucosa]|uniref:Calmodulin n=1 Tax=Triparma verrucosa TaxID=1606542 RepID=A0A9W7CCH1_9STRA|nr:hypothetical protein TrVE_jg10079 [Triparma verrucosa]
MPGQATTPKSHSKFRRSKGLPDSPSSGLRYSRSDSKLPRDGSATSNEANFVNTMKRLDRNFTVVVPGVSRDTVVRKLPSTSLEDKKEELIYMHVMKDAEQDGINIHSYTDLESRVLYFVEKGSVLTCSMKRRVLGVPWYKVCAPMEGWACGELPTDRAHVLLADQEETMILQYPTLMKVDKLYAEKRFELEKLERRTLAAQIVRLLIQCYGLHDARKVAKDTKQIVNSMEPMSQYGLELTEFSDVDQDHLGVDGTPKKVNPYDIIPMMTKITVHHSHPQLALLDIAEQVLTIANMRPSEWGYQEWGWEGEYGHRVQILDDMTRQQRTNHFVAAAGAGRVKEVEERLKHHQYIDGVHTKMHYTALHAAADFGHVEVVELLIKSGFDKFIDMVDVRYKQTALHYAAMNGRMDVVMCLLEHGANRHARDKDNFMPRDIAMIWHKLEVAVVLKEVPPPVPGFRVGTVSSHTCQVEWDEPVLDDANEAPVTHYELSHRMKSSEQTHIDNAKLSLEWTRMPLIEYDATVGKRGERKYLFSDLLAASGHEFMMRCKNICGWSPASPVIMQYTPGCEPSAPSVPYLVKTTRTSIMVEWHPPKHKNGAGLKGYEIKYRRVGDDPKEDPKAHLRFIFQEMDKDGGGMVEKQEFVKALDTFGFRLNVKQIKRLCDRLDSDRDGSIDFKEFVSFCEESDESQEHQLLLDKRGGKNSESDKELAKLLQFELKRISMGKNPVTKWESVEFHALQYCAKSFERLVVFGMYEFVIRCKNNYGWGGWSEIGGPFKLIDGLWASDFTARSITLEWQKLIEIFPVLAYEVQLREIKHKGARAVNDKDYKTVTNTIKDRKLVVDGLVPNTYYNFRVRPCVATAAAFADDATHGEWRPWVFGISTDVIHTLSDKPDPIRGCRVLEGEDACTHNSLEINWTLGRDNGSRIIESEIRIKEDMQQWLPWTVLSKGGFNGKVVEGLEAGCGYQFSVRCRNEHGWTDWCELSAVKETRGAIPPGKVTVVKENHGRRGIVAADASWIHCEWTPPQDNSLGCPEHYELQVCNRNVGADDVWETVGVVDCTGAKELKEDGSVEPNLEDCNFFINNLKSCVNYVIRVRSCTARGWSVWGEESEEIATLGRF